MKQSQSYPQYYEWSLPFFNYLKLSKSQAKTEKDTKVKTATIVKMQIMAI